MGLIPADVRHGARRLAATPLLSAGAILVLALGIGSAVVMADVLDRILLRAPAHVADPDRVARVYFRFPGATSYIDRTGYATFEALNTLPEDLEAAAVFFSGELSYGRGPEARRLESVAHSPGYFAVLGVTPIVGNLPDASNPAGEDAAIISHALWQQAFGGAPDVLGKPLSLGEHTYVIVAVAPRGFAGLGYKSPDVWLPLARRAPASFGAEWKKSAVFLQAAVRLRPGVSREKASERATAAFRAHAEVWNRNAAVVLGDVRPARAPGADTRTEVLVAGMSILVLLITCGNVANFLLVRGLRRDREFLVKTALGATRVQLLREVLVEAAVLAVAAGAVALVVVTTGGTGVRRLFLSPVAALAAPLDARLVLVTAGFCAAAAFLLGLAPAWRLSARRALAPGAAATVRPSRVLDLFCGLQVALSLPLIVAAALFVLSLWNARNQDFGMRTDRVVVVTTNLFELGRPWENHQAHRLIEESIARLPQVESTAIIEHMPMQSRTSFPVFVPGSVPDPGPVMITNEMPGFNSVDPSFFAVMRMRLVEGRLFTEEENTRGARSVAVLTQTMARDLWPGESAVGKCFRMFDPSNPVCTEVVGVVADARLFPSIRPTKEWASTCYLPLEQQGGVSSRALLVRTNTDPARVLPLIRREAQAAAADLPYVDVHAFDDLFETMLKPWRLGSTVFVIFGALSMLVAAAGLAVVAAYAVARRTREMGIRSALGATPGKLVALVLARSLLVIAAGLAAGLGLAWAGGRLLQSQLFGVAAGDARVLGGATLLLLFIGAGAAWIPARRAARVDPVAALRTE